MKTFGFQEQLKIGSDGEAKFILGYPGAKLIPFAGREYDFDREDGKRVELKTDTYVGSPNFFFERWSDEARQKPGSVWQSIDKADVFIYCFINEGVYYEFPRMKILLNRLEKLIVGMPLIKIKNRGWTAGGYKIPRASIIDLSIEGKLREIKA